MSADKTPAPEKLETLGNRYFKLQKEIDKLVDEQNKIREEIQARFEEERFDKIDAQLGSVSVVVSGGATWKFADPDKEAAATVIQKTLDNISSKKKVLSDRSKELTVEAKEPTKKLADLRKDFAVKEIEEGAKTSLRFTINK